MFNLFGSTKSLLSIRNIRTLRRNRPIINKTKHPKKGEKMGVIGRGGGGGEILLFLYVPTSP
jgi:hypothetical protein